MNIICTTVVLDSCTTSCISNLPFYNILNFFPTRRFASEMLQKGIFGPCDESSPVQVSNSFARTKHTAHMKAYHGKFFCYAVHLMMYLIHCIVFHKYLVTSNKMEPWQAKLWDNVQQVKYP